MESHAEILPRAAASAIQHALRTSPVVVVLGARQTGKTTLVRGLPQLAERPYLTLDDFDLRVQAAADPEAVVDRAPSLVIDEVQRVRDLLNAVKRAVDRDPKRRPGRFVLAGSARSAQSGRARARCRNKSAASPQIRQSHGDELSGHTLARLCRESHQASHQGPQALLVRYGSCAPLTGESELRGAHLENLILMDLFAWRDTQVRKPEVLYWRTATGEEVDLVIETPSRTIPVEVKTATRLGPADARGLESFLDEYADSTDGALLLYAGNETFPLTKRVFAVPWWRVC